MEGQPMTTALYARGRDPLDDELAAALVRLLDNKRVPGYLRRAAVRWLERHGDGVG